VGLEENSAVAINCHTGRAKRIAASSMYQSCGSRCQRWLFANERELQALGIQIQALESRLNEFEDRLRVRRESGPVRR
jgi:hypothetical protein